MSTWRGKLPASRHGPYVFLCSPTPGGLSDVNQTPTANGRTRSARAQGKASVLSSTAMCLDVHSRCTCILQAEAWPARGIRVTKAFLRRVVVSLAEPACWLPANELEHGPASVSSSSSPQQEFRPNSCAAGARIDPGRSLARLIAACGTAQSCSTSGGGQVDADGRATPPERTDLPPAHPRAHVASLTPASCVESATHARGLFTAAGCRSCTVNE